MFEQKPLDPPLSFDEVVAAERKFLRAGEETGKPSEPVTALCISGGGIRSATFALGAIQGLAEKGILSSFDYLSTVSGGGYIGSWLTAWKQRQGGLEKILPALQPAAPFPPQTEPDPLQHLREYNNYLSPRLGVFSADTWTLAATVGRNMMLNWLVLVPLLMFVLMAPRLLLSLARMGDYLNSLYGWDWIQRTPLATVLAILSGLAFAVATFFSLRYLPGVGKTNHTETDFIKRCLVPLLVSALLFFTMEAWITGGDAKHKWSTTVTYPGLLFGISGSNMAAWIVYLAVYFRKTCRHIALIGELTVGLLLMSVGTASLVWLLVSDIFPHMGWGSSYIACAPPLLLLAFALPVVLFVGITSDVLQDEDREWLARAGAWLLLFVLCWAGICSLVLAAPSWEFGLPAWGRSAFAAAGGAGGILTALIGFGLRVKGRGSESLPDEPAKSRGFLSVGVILQLFAAVFVVIFLVGLANLTNWLLWVAGVVPVDWTDHHQFVEHTPTRWVLAGAAVFLGVAWLMARFIDINKFSLHAMYRNRLIRAYIGASNRIDDVNQFIGFASNDDLPMHQLRPELKPFHVINVTLNLVAGRRLAWQQRKAESFTVTPLHCGSSQLGYRPSDEYAHGISLGTAMTLSGAAASPNMGYYSSPTIGFIMTLFNARLGAWLGNPGPPGAATWRKQGPKSAVSSIVREVFGLTNECCPYVYLSDGGHFENLGMYEMVRRTCRYIVVLDGAADGDLQFKDLGNALRKIRIDTKIDFQFNDSWEHHLRDHKTRWAVAKILYRAAGKADEDGYLIYIKPLMSGSEPPDVVAYQAAHPQFPHESTANQFFNESQTESYRMLGLQTIRDVFADWTPAKGIAGLAKDMFEGKAAKAATAKSGT
jgi:hypothetical protein